MLGNSDWVVSNHPYTIYQEMEETLLGDWSAWDPDTLVRQLPALEGQPALDKVLAVQATAHDSTRVCTISTVLENVVHAFCNLPMVPDVHQPPEMCELVYAVKQLELIIKAVHATDLVFSGEVPGYVAAVAKFRKMLILPETLAFAQKQLDALQGINAASRRGMDLKEHLDEARTIAKLLSGADYTGADLSVLDDLDQRHKAEQVPTMRTLIGCYLYNPTKV